MKRRRCRNRRCPDLLMDNPTWKDILRLLPAFAAYLLFAAAPWAKASAADDAAPTERQVDRLRRAPWREAIERAVEGRLQRLRENGLEDLAVYRHLTALRDNPAGAVALALSTHDSELLDNFTPSQDDLSRAASETINLLLQEPRDLRRRLKFAEIKQAAQDAPKSADRLRRLLDEVRRFPGSLGRVASDGLALLDGAGSTAALTFLETTEPLLALDREAAAACIADLRERQAEIRSVAGRSELSNRAADELVARQADIRRTLRQGSPVLGRTPAARRLVAAAEAAADAATQRLFDLDLAAAADQQQRVNDGLAELAALFDRAIERDRAELDAAGWAARAAELASTRDQLTAAARQLDPSRGQDQLERLARQVDGRLDDGNLPSLVDAELLRTLLSVRGAATAWEAARDDDARAALVEQSRQALDRAASACAAELARGRPPATLSPANHKAHEQARRGPPHPNFDLTRQPWFSKLPPENQRAIRTREKPLPLGYEERLKAYFEEHAAQLPQQ